MKQLDERILEVLGEDDWSSPYLMSQRPEFDASEGRLLERCRALEYAGLISAWADEMYEVTTWGQLYLQGDLDAQHQPRPTRAVVG